MQAFHNWPPFVGLLLFLHLQPHSACSEKCALLLKGECALFPGLHLPVALPPPCCLSDLPSPRTCSSTGSLHLSEIVLTFLSCPQPQWYIFIIWALGYNVAIVILPWDHLPGSSMVTVYALPMCGLKPTPQPSVYSFRSWNVGTP